MCCFFVIKKTCGKLSLCGHNFNYTAGGADEDNEIKICWNK